MVALDGYRLAIYRDVPQNHRLPVDFVVPARYLSEIARTLGDGKEDISLYLGQNQMMVDLGNTRITTRLLEGEYIKYQAILPKEYATRVRVSPKTLLESVERASLMASAGKNNLIKIAITDGSLVLTANSELGDVYEDMEIEKEGKDIEIAFNARYLMESLRATGEKDVYLDFNSNINPCVITPVEGDRFLYWCYPSASMGRSRIAASGEKRSVGYGSIQHNYFEPWSQAIECPALFATAAQSRMPIGRFSETSFVPAEVFLPQRLLTAFIGRPLSSVS